MIRIRMPSRILRCFAWCFVLGGMLAGFASLTPARAAMMAEPVVVVELFTSQGCSSCPPANEFLGELAERKGLLALSYHVDYWNYMGWKDPFSSAQMTQRQRAYLPNLGQRYVFTPQMVIDGTAQGEGASRSKIEALLVEARKDIDKKLVIKVARGGINEVKVGLPARRMMEKKPADAPPAPMMKAATLWLVAYDTKHATEVLKGENSGRTINSYNVVRSIKPAATWQGKPMDVVLNLAEEIAAGYQNCAVLLQSGDGGRILAAARLPMPVTIGGGSPD